MNLRRVIFICALLMFWCSAGGTWELKFEPSFLPLSVKYDSELGLSGLEVKISGKVETPLGVFSFKSGSLLESGNKCLKVAHGDVITTYPLRGFIVPKNIPEGARISTESDGSIFVDLRKTTVVDHTLESTRVPTFSEGFYKYLQDNVECFPVYGSFRLGWNEPNDGMVFGTLRMYGCTGTLTVWKWDWQKDTSITIEQEMLTWKHTNDIYSFYAERAVFSGTTNSYPGFMPKAFVFKRDVSGRWTSYVHDGLGNFVSWLYEN